MGAKELTAMNKKSEHFLQLFRAGNERALTYFYQKTFTSLLYVGKGLINDEFLVTCILQECYLKAWTYREKIESFSHAYRFIRMNLRWQVLKQIKKTTYQQYRRTLFESQLETAIIPAEDLPEKAEDVLPLNRVEEIFLLTKNLSYERQLILRLHFREGYCQKQIARRLGKHTGQITREIEKSIELLKKMALPESKTNSVLMPSKQLDTYEQLLTSDQACIYTYRKQKKMSFGEIAEIVGYPQFQVQQLYIQACQKIKIQQKKI